MRLEPHTEPIVMSRKIRTVEAAKYTGLSSSTLTKMRLTGAGPIYLKIGKIVVYEIRDIEEWLISKRRRATTCFE